MMVMRNETKDVVAGFEDIMRTVSEFSTENSTLGDGTLPLKIAFNSDLSAGWKIRGIGGAAKQKTLPCHCCAVRSDDLATANGVLCGKYCETLHGNRDGWCCYHQPFLSEEYTATLEEELASTGAIIGTLLPNLDNLAKDSTIHTAEDPRYSSPSSANDVLSIHYDVGKATKNSRKEYSTHINSDLLIRQLPVNGPLIERQERLRESLVMEYKYRQLRDAVAHGRKSEAHAIVKLHETVPCILHMENRIGLKILTMLLIEGLQNALRGTTFAGYATENQRMRAFFLEIERILNTRVWGTEDNPTQWQCPRDETKKELGVLCLDNNKTRKAINNLEILYQFCIVESTISTSR